MRADAERIEAVYDTAARIFDGSAPKFVRIEVATSMALQLAALERENAALKTELQRHRLVAEARHGR